MFLQIHFCRFFILLFTQKHFIPLIFLYSFVIVVIIVLIAKTKGHRVFPKGTSHMSFSLLLLYWLGS